MRRGRAFFGGIILLASASACGAPASAPKEPTSVAPAVAPTHAYDCASRDAKPGDSDGDGVPDTIDACPCAPGPAFTDDAPNVKGCPFDAAPRPHPSPSTVEIMVQIQFASGVSIPSATSDATLESVRDLMQSHLEITVLGIHGHTDAREAGANADALSTARAAAVRAWLVAHGVDANRLVACGYAARLPIDSDEKAETRQRNRRVDFHIYADADDPASSGARACHADAPTK